MEFHDPNETKEERKKRELKAKESKRETKQQRERREAHERMIEREQRPNDVLIRQWLSLAAMHQTVRSPHPLACIKYELKSHCPVVFGIPHSADSYRPTMRRGSSISIVREQSMKLSSQLIR